MMTMDSYYAFMRSKRGRLSVSYLFIIRPQSNIIFLLFMVRIRHDRPTSQPAPRGKIETLCIIIYGVNQH